MARKRGVVLTRQGYQRLQKAQQEWENRENYGVTYTIEALSELTQLDPATVSKVLHREMGVDKRTLERFFRVFNLELCQSDYAKPDVVPQTSEAISISHQNKLVWGEAPDISIFYGRTQELDILQKWIIEDHCRLITLIGIGGIGKTSLSVKLAQNVSEKFTHVIWLSLRNAPPPLEIIANLIQLLSNGEEIDLPKNITQIINRLLEYLQKQRCLLVFDNLETIFSSDNYAGYYLPGYEGYGELLLRIGETQHQSCLLITSREKPKEVAAMAGNQLPIRSLYIHGLSIAEGQKIFGAKGIVGYSNSDWENLIISYGGNPLYLKIIATTILDLFNGSIADFIAQGTTVFGDVRNLVSQQFNRLSLLEKSILYWLAINRKPVELNELKADLLSPIGPSNLLEVLESLYRRSLIEKKDSQFTLQSVVMEYVTMNLIEQVCQEIATAKVSLFQSHALIKATAADYIQEIQIRLILTSIIENLQVLLGNTSQIKSQLLNIINCYRGQAPYVTGYIGGNTINLLSQLLPKISNEDFSNLTIWQANLQRCNLQDVNFSHSHFTKSFFTNTFGIIFSLTFSSDNELLVTGSIDGELCLWQWRENHQLFRQQAHTTIIESIAFSPDCQLIASSSRDKTVKLWDVSTGQCLLNLPSPDGTIKNIAFSQNSKKLFGCLERQIISWDVQTGICSTLVAYQSRISAMAVSTHNDILIFGCVDGTINILDTNTGKFVENFSTSSGVILSVIVSDEDKILASSLTNKTLKIWDVNARCCIVDLSAQSYKFSLIAISLNGLTLATGSGEKIIKTWDIHTNKYLQSLEGHLSEINTIALSPNSKILATGSVDRTVKLWDVTTGKCLKTLQGRTDFVHSVGFSHDGKIVASGSQHEIRLWDVNSGQCVTNISAYKDWLYSLALSSDGKLLACANLGNENHIIRLWQIQSLHKGNSYQAPDKILQGHTDNIWAIAFSPDGKIIVSGSSDRTVKLWDSQTGQCLQTFSGHTRPVLSVAFSLDGQIIASCGGHSIIKVWDVITGECCQTIQEVASYVLKFSPNSYILASGNTSGVIKLWDVRDGQCIGILGKYGKPIISLAFSPDGQILASGSFDGTVTLWNINTNQCINTIEINTGSAWSLDFSPDGKNLACGSNGETIHLCDLNIDKDIKILQGDRPYEGMNIQGVTGLTPNIIASVKALGAVD
ncbi:eIF2A-related protein [Anabaena sp. WFMT]|uniref:WD40 repeat domain-containing protein n=1 Tax=Anabaena sp. WFMT TaxID=3449730 RepID=UPI003F29997E